MSDASAEKRKVILIGLDGLMPELIDRYREHIPELSDLLAEGYYSPALPSPYSCTATNWATIATGAWVGTHGCTSFHAHLPGMEVGETVGTMNSRLCQAEYFWQTAERQGKRCILINYPKAFPLTLKDGVAIGGDGLISQDWTIRWPELISSFRDVPNCNRLTLQPAREWSNVPSRYEVLGEGVVNLEYQVPFDWAAVGMTEGEQREVSSVESRYILIVKEGDATKLILSRSRDAQDALAILAKNDWSGWVEEEFNGEKCMRQYKVLDLSADGQEITLYGTIAGSHVGWGYPEGIEKDIVANAGAYVEALELVADQALTDGWFGPDVALETMHIQAEWAAACAAYLNATQPWDVMFVQYHEPDGINHLVLGDLEHPDSARRDEADSFLRETVRLLFQMVSSIRQQCADENTVVCVVSDHGNIPLTRYINAHGIMEREGWEEFLQDSETGQWFLDTQRSRAVAELRQSGVWINLEGREKYGCVKPGDEYECLRSQVIERLRRIVDSETGEGVFALVGRREDFHGFGMWGDRIPDIIAFAKPYYLFTGAHRGVAPRLMTFYRSSGEVTSLEQAIAAGVIRPLTAVHWHLPNATVGYASNRAMCILTGPGIERGKRGERVNLVDVAPTLAHLLDIRPPEQCEGRIIWQAIQT